MSCNSCRRCITLLACKHRGRPRGVPTSTGELQSAGLGLPGVQNSAKASPSGAGAARVDVEAARIREPTTRLTLFLWVMTSILLKWL
ncbi:hypothetical protein D3C85_1761560 [compost metagenome]